MIERIMSVSIGFALMLLVAVSAALADSSTSNTSDPQLNTVADELSQLSGLPESEVQTVLADCAANQQSMYFCAWRDQIQSQRLLNQAIATKVKKSPDCKTKLEPKVAAWSKRRDKVCAQSAEAEWGTGSMKPTAQATCVAKETERVAKLIKKSATCDLKY